MKAIEFLMPYTVGALFNEGEIAGFDEALADELIERGIAKAVKASGSKKAADEADKA